MKEGLFDVVNKERGLNYGWPLTLNGAVVVVVFVMSSS